MNCTLTPDQQKAFYKKVFKDLLTAADTKTPFDLKAYIGSIYDLVNNSTKDPSLALNYAQLVPENITVALKDRKVRDYIRSTTSTDTIYDLQSDFSDNISNVEKYLSPAMPTEAEIKELDKQSKLSQADKIRAELNPDYAFEALVFSSFTTTDQEEERIGVKFTGEVDLEPRKVASFNLQRNTLTTLTDQGLDNADTIPVLNGTGLFLTPVRETVVGGTSGLIVLAYATKVNDEIKIIYTDKEGNPVAFLDSEVVPEDAVVPYTKLRAPIMKEGKLTNPTVKDARSIAKSLNPDGSEVEINQLTKAIATKHQEEFVYLKNLIDFTKKNPSVRLNLSITGGSMGYSNANKENRLKLGEIKNLSSNFTFFTVRDSKALNNGFSYLQLDRYYKPLQVHGNQLTDIQAETLARYAADESQSAQKRYNVLSNIINPTNNTVSIDISGDSLIVLNNGKQVYVTGGVTNVSQEELIDIFKQAYINVNDSLLGLSIEVPAYVNGNLVYNNRDYRQFIRENTFVFGVLRNNGTLREYNAHLNFESTPLVVEEVGFQPQVEEARPVVERPKAKVVKSLPGLGDVKFDLDQDFINNVNDSLKRAGKPTVKMSNAEIKRAKNWYNNLKVKKDGVEVSLSSVLPFNEAFALANSDVLGTFTTDGITLFTQAGNKDYSTLYHEAWHGFSQLLLSKDQKQKLYDETRKLVPSLKNKSDLEVEEYLAEDFRDYMMKEGSKIIRGTQRKNIFQRILDLLKSLFTGYTYSEVVSNPTGVEMIKQMYDNLSKGQLFEYQYSLDNVQFGQLNRGIEKTTTDYPKEISLADSIMISDSVDSLFSQMADTMGLSYPVLFSNIELRKKLYDQVYKAFNQRLQDFDEYVEGKDPATVTAQLHAIEVLEYAIDNFGEFDGDTGVIAYHRERSKYLTFDSKYVKDSEEIPVDDLGQLELFERTGNKYSIKDLATNQTLYMIKGLNEVDSKGNYVNNSLGFRKLVEFSNAFNKVSKILTGSQTFDDIVSRLSQASVSYPQAAQLLTKLGSPLNTTTSLAQYNLWRGFLRTFDKTMIPIVEMVIETSYGKQETVTSVRRATGDIEKVKREFLSQFQSVSNQYVTRTDSGNQLNVAKVLADFPSVTKANVFDFLHAVGFYMDDNVSVKEALQNTIGLRSSEGGIGYSFLRNALVDNKEIIYDPIKFFRKAQQATNVNKILDIQATYGDAQFNNGITNAEGNVEYEASERFSLSNMVDDLNALDNIDQVLTDKRYEHLKAFHPTKNPYAEYSLILRSLFDSNGNRRRDVKISLDNLNGVRRVDNDATIAGFKTNKLSKEDKFLLDLHTFILKGSPELPRHASKSSSYSVYASKIITDKTSDYLYVPLSKIGESRTGGIIEATPILLDQLAAELKRIWYVKNTESLKTIDTLSSRGDMIFAFDSVVSNANKAELYKLVDKVKSVDDIRTALDETELQKKLQRDFYTYFNDQYREALSRLADIPFLSPQIKAQVIRQVKGVVDETKVTDIILRAYVLNNFIHNFDLQLFYGDLSQFNEAKEEYHKRIASIASTGVFANIDEYSAGLINGLSDSTYAKSKGIETRAFDGKFRSVVYQDAKSESVYYNDYKEAIQKALEDKNIVDAVDQAEKIAAPYKEINEGDAQGWINFDSYRNFLVLINRWSSEQQKMYEDIVAGKEINPLTVTQTFPVLKASYYGPIETEVLNVTALHKFSLLPLVPTVVKGTHLENLLDTMMNNQIDYALYETGSKISNVTLEDGTIPRLYKNVEKRELYTGELPITTVYLKYFKNQLDISPKFKNEVTLASQLRKLIETNLYQKGGPVQPKYAKLVESYEQALADYVNFFKKRLFKEAGVTLNENGTYSKKDASKIVDAIRREFIRMEVPEHQMGVLDQNADGTLRSHLDLSVNSGAIERMLVALVERKIIKPKVNGEALVQVSSSGFESQKFTKPTEDVLAKYGTNGLTSYRVADGKIQPMQVKIALQGQFKKLLQLKDLDGIQIETLERLNEVIKDPAWNKKYSKYLEMVAVRIPVQGLNSMEYMTVAEFLPVEAGSVIVVAPELVAKSGSDFDIDKLNVIMPNIITETSPDEVALYENKILFAMSDILSLKDNFVDLIKPNDVGLVKGLADELAKYNTDYNPFSKTDNQNPDFKMSPTRAFEFDYNLYKHESNNIGKKTLGIGAVSNTYNIVLNRVGAYLNKQYQVKSVRYGKADKKTDKDDDTLVSVNIFSTSLEENAKPKELTQTRETRILLPHNSVKGLVSLSTISDVNDINKIQDVISQLINGWVDIEKDAWIFNLNANYELTPTLLFLLQAGVPIETAAYFISQPLIKEYLFNLSKESSLFNNTLEGNAKSNVGLAKQRARQKVIVDNIDYNAKIKNPGSKLEIYNILNSLIKEYQITSKDFTISKLKKIVKDGDTQSPLAQVAFMHFLEIQEMANVMRAISSSTNVDTSKAGDLFNASKKINNLVELEENTLLPTKVTEAITTNSPIAPFFIQDYVLNLYKDLFPVRGNIKINDYLSKYVSKNLFKIGFDKVDSFVRNFRNDFSLFVFQNAATAVDINNLTSYKGAMVTDKVTEFSVEQAKNLKKGIAYKDGVIYIEPDKIKLQFKNNAWSTDEYNEYGLYRLPASIIGDPVTYFPSLRTYSAFVVEREYLRGTQPQTADESKQQFERRIAEDALSNVFNLRHIFFTNNSFADQLVDIKQQYPELVEQYDLLDNLVYDTGRVSKKSSLIIRNIRLQGNVKDKDYISAMNQQLEQLADPTVVKLDDSAENYRLSQFFQKLNIFAFLQSGMNPSTLSFTSIVSDKVYKSLMEAPLQRYVADLSDSMLQKFTNLFLNNINTPGSYRFKNYVQAASVDKIGANIDILSESKVEGADYYTYDYKANFTKELDPNYVLVHPSALDGSGTNTTPLATRLGDAKYAANALALPTYSKVVGGKAQSITKAEEADAIGRINDAVNNIVIAKNEGKTLVFDKKGYGELSTDPNVSQESLLYLSKRLFDEFGFINPVMRNSKEFMNYVYSSQPLNVVEDLEVVTEGVTVSDKKRVTIQMQPANIEKIKAGTKTTTTRSETQAQQINIPIGQSAIVNFGGQDFTVTNRGLLTIEEAGGKAAIIKSEGVKSEEDFMYKQTKDWVNGKGKLYVYDITPVSSIEVQGVDSISQIDFQEDQNTGYAERTKKNASADATIAIAIDFNTAGEKLTKKSVTNQNKKYIPVNANNLAVTRERVEAIVAALNSVDAKSLNIAGNGIYTMKGKYTQEQVDNFTYELLKAVVESPNLKNQIESIRTGGQTGFDEAGAKAGIKLGIPTIILAPKGWKYRDVNGNDISSEQQFKNRFKSLSIQQKDDNLPDTECGLGGIM